MKKIAIVGAGGFGREVLQLIRDIGQVAATYDAVGFIDDSTEMQNQKVAGLPVLGTMSSIKEAGSSSGIDSLAIGIGNPVYRRKAYLNLAGLFKFPKLIHPSAIIGERSIIEDGVLVTAGNIITVDCLISEASMINLNCTVGHDAVIQKYCVINPGVCVSGAAFIEEGVLLGTSSTILEGRRVSEWSVVGGGAVVNSDIPANSTAVGVPAKVIKTKEQGWYR